ncbi:nucleotide sugar dehydrogenase [Bacillus horti]|uniref:UDP-N-acetyl-D-glucosamine dehydrogenase n=1 Tax=Caldalkalibacillus horti TaxID=77523 RepID=A0ABT9W4C3_9BACI|nr:UDP-N-acetyl-D-glucosamine dehydrogenase [Bacillus horti]
MRYDQQTSIHVAIVGLGYVGLPLARLCVEKGLRVTGIDIDSSKLAHLSEGKSYLTDMTDRQIKQLTEGQFFNWTDQYDDLRNCDACILCVPTPLTEHAYPDLSYLQSAVESVSPLMKRGQLIVLESSTFPGTTEDIVLPILSRNGAKLGEDFYLGYSPERIDPGNTSLELQDIPKVISGQTAHCQKKIYELYSLLFRNLVEVSTPKVAELTKLLENSQRFINLAFMNEMAVICHGLDLNIWEAIEAASTKPYGFMTYYPGPGIGGHCIPVDPLYLQWKAKEKGFTTSFIHLSKSLNDQMPVYIVERILQLLFSKQQKDNYKVLVIGVSYKKDVNDTRESTSIMVMEQLLQQKNIAVSFHDPLVPQIKLKGSIYRSEELTVKVIKQADCVVILTNHSTVHYDSILRYASIIFDTRYTFKQSHPSVVRL